MRSPSSEDITINVIRKNIKNTYLRVKPDGTVTVTTSIYTPQERIQAFINSHFTWIRHKVALVRARRPAQDSITTNSASPNTFPTPAGQSSLPAPGATVNLWGKRLSLDYKIPALRQDIAQAGDKLLISAHHQLTTATFNAMLQTFFEAEINKRTAALWLPCQQLVGVKAKDYHFRSMSTRWGSCNVRTGRICLNLNLVHYDPICLRYILMHELVHLLERGHNARFYGYMDKFMPEWRQVKRLLR